MIISLADYETEILNRNWESVVDALRKDPESEVFISIGDPGSIGLDLYGFWSEEQAQRFCDLATPDLIAAIEPAGDSWAGQCRQVVHVKLRKP